MIMKAKLKADRMCQKIKTGNHRWTPELTAAIQAVLNWKGLAKCKKGAEWEKNS